MGNDKRIGELNDKFAASKFATNFDRHLEMLRYMSAMQKTIEEMQEERAIWNKICMEHDFQGFKVIEDESVPEGKYKIIKGRG